MVLSFPAQMRVGLVPMSAKPMQRGHYDLIERAVSECDHVIVYVSMGDRKRPGEFPIFGADMLKIWRTYIEPTFSDEVEVEYVTSPVGSVFKQLGAEDERYKAGDTDVATYVIYAGEDDAATNFPAASLKRYAGSLHAADMIDVTHVARSPYSGTSMRAYLSAGDAKKFKASLPEVLDEPAREAIWQLLFTSGRGQIVTTGKISRRSRAKPSR
jgi:hypothetical protein